MNGPDYGAALYQWKTGMGPKAIVDAAIGERRLVSPTAIIIERDEDGEWPTFPNGVDRCFEYVLAALVDIPLDADANKEDER